MDYHDLLRECRDSAKEEVAEGKDTKRLQITFTKDEEKHAVNNLIDTYFKNLSVSKFEEETIVDGSSDEIAELRSDLQHLVVRYKGISVGGTNESKVNEEEFAQPDMQKPGKKLPRKKLHKKVVAPEKPEELEDPKPEDIKPDKDLDAPDVALTADDKPKALPDTDNEPAPVDDDVPPPPDEILEPEQPIEMRKEYLGKTEDTYYYFVTTESESGDISDFVLVNQEGAKLFTASEHEIEIAEENIPDFIRDAIRDVKVASIERSIFMKYIYPKLIEENPSDEEFLDEHPKEEDKSEEEKRTQSEEEGTAPPEGPPRESIKKVNEQVETTVIDLIVDHIDSEYPSAQAISIESVRDYVSQFESEIVEAVVKKLISIGFDVSEKKKGPTCDEARVDEEMPTKINVGDKITSPKGHKISIKDIWVEGTHLDPTTWVEYDFVTTGGHSGTEKNSLLNLLKNLKEEEPMDESDVAGWRKASNKSRLDKMKKDKCPKCGGTNLGSQQEGGETSSWKTHKWCKDCDWDSYQVDESLYCGRPGLEYSNVPWAFVLTETKVVDTAGNEFTVYLLDEGGTDTVIEVNGRKFNFSQDFASMWRDEAGVLSEAGLKELALDALANLGEEEHAELISQASAEEPEKSEELMDENQLNEDAREMEAELDVFDQMSMDELLDAVGETRKDLPEKEDLIDELMLRKFGKEYSGYLKRQVGIESKENNEGVIKMNETDVDGVFVHSPKDHVGLAKQEEIDGKKTWSIAGKDFEQTISGLIDFLLGLGYTVSDSSDQGGDVVITKDTNEGKFVVETKTDVDEAKIDETDVTKGAKALIGLAKEALKNGDYAKAAEHCQNLAQIEAVIPAEAEKEVKDEPKDEPKDKPKDKPEDKLEDKPEDKPEEDDLDDLLKDESKEETPETLHDVDEAKEKEAKAKEKEAKAKAKKEAKAKEKEAKAKKEKEAKAKAKAKKESKISVENKVDLSESKGVTRLKDLLNL